MQKSTRIKILLVIDTLFFLLEIIVGYAVHSLALVADSFHMVCPLTLDSPQMRCFILCVMKLMVT